MNLSSFGFSHFGNRINFSTFSQAFQEIFAALCIPQAFFRSLKNFGAAENFPAGDRWLYGKYLTLSGEIFKFKSVNSVLFKKCKKPALSLRGIAPDFIILR